MGFEVAKVYKDYKDTDLVVELDSQIRLSAFTGTQAQAAIDLFRYYQRAGYWSAKQKRYVCYLLKKRKVMASSLNKGDYKLYAIAAIDQVKLGFSLNPKRRMKTLQTANAHTLNILWEYPAGKTQKAAKGAERSLHNYCKEYRLNGEWFKPEVMRKVNNFVLGKKQIVEADLDLAALGELAARGLC